MPTVDEVFAKIREHGIASLTIEETEVLTSTPDITLVHFAAQWGGHDMFALVESNRRLKLAVIQGTEAADKIGGKLVWFTGALVALTLILAIEVVWRMFEAWSLTH
jgi:hypothetical protein